MIKNEVLIILEEKFCTKKVFEFIKKMRRYNKTKVNVCLVSQYKEQLDLNSIDLTVNFHLILSEDKTFIEKSNLILVELERVIKILNTDVMIIFGNSVTSLNASLAANRNNIKIVYINSFFKVDNCKNYVLENIINEVINDLATFKF